MRTVIPGCSLRLVLTKTPDKVMLITGEDEAKLDLGFTLKGNGRRGGGGGIFQPYMCICECLIIFHVDVMILCPLATLTDSIYSELRLRLKKEPSKTFISRYLLDFREKIATYFNFLKFLENSMGHIGCDCKKSQPT